MLTIRMGLAGGCNSSDVKSTTGRAVMLGRLSASASDEFRSLWKYESSVAIHASIGMPEKKGTGAFQNSPRPLFSLRLQPTVDMGMRPIWRRLVSDAFFHGEMADVATLVSYLADRKPWWRHSWGGDAFGSVDPEKELKAHQIGLETGQETLAMIAAERNADWKDC